MNSRTLGWLVAAGFFLASGLALFCSGHTTAGPLAGTACGVSLILSVANWDGPRARRQRAAGTDYRRVDRRGTD